MDTLWSLKIYFHYDTIRIIDCWNLDVSIVLIFL